MTSRKRSSKKKTSPQSSSGNPCTNEEIVPKEEFEYGLARTGFRARPRFTFGFKAMRRVIGFRFGRWRFLPDSFRLKSATGRRLI
ncbi:hypothetical protein DY000_02015508 [Brassica cretica]|uniref:Uncharacterized protein n=1 Tax=Brassica cretica TaxID=69181 RepID=A0ABQ7D1J1_BRACR|nr:hypothetical protein DY000_02015508 [Brassica cretica]